jgi:16S rRNA (guanine(966)-N(2))-methyltransferase RsmD
MRVIAGSAKGRSLFTVPGDSTRPITDRVKSALFSILTSQDAIMGRRFLDLFGGTGAVGIEALSRGAGHVVFCERNRRAVETLLRNLDHTGVQARAEVVRSDAFAYLQHYHGPAFDLIYVAPPQYQGLWEKALHLIDVKPDLLTTDGQVVVQMHPKEEKDLALQFLELSDRRQYGSTRLLFFCRVDESAEPADPGVDASERVDVSLDDVVT